MADIFHGRTLYSVQAFRGIAALLVVLFHTTQFIATKYGVVPFRGVFLFGFAGLHLFFVLSGYIIYFIHHRDIGRPGRVFPFARKRIIRIYPAYLAILAIYALSPSLSGRLDMAGLLRNAALFGEMPHRFVVPTAWTLWYEMMFYGLFGVLIILGRPVYYLFAAWLAGIILVEAGVLRSGYPLLSHPFNFLFLMGVATAAVTFRLVQWRRGHRISAILVAAGAAGFGVAAFYSAVNSAPDNIVPWTTWPYILAFGTASALLLFAPLSDRIEGFFSRRGRLLFLGDASYSIYLIHYPLVKLLVTWFRKIPSGFGIQSHWAADLGLVLVTGLVLAVGGLFYRKVEYPMLSFLRRKTA